MVSASFAAPGAGGSEVCEIVVLPRYRASRIVARSPGKEPPVTANRPPLTPAMTAMIEKVRLCFVATTRPDGRPNLSPKGTLHVLDDRRLAFADIASPGTVANLRRNPAIEINVVDPFVRKGYRFAGAAEVLAEGELFDAVKTRLARRRGPPLPVSHVVVVTVERAAPLVSPAYMVEPGLSEDALRREWLAIYGLRPAAD